MPQYRLKVKNLDTGLIDRVSVWASNSREAHKLALEIAKKLLSTKNVEIV